MVAPGVNGNVVHTFQTRATSINTTTITSLSVPNSYSVGVNTGDCRYFINPASNNPTATNTHTTNTPTGTLYPVLAIHKANEACSAERAVSIVVDRITVRKFDRTYSPTITVDAENTIVSGRTLTFSDNFTLSGLTLNSSGTLTIDNGDILTINGTYSGGGTLNNNGTIAYASTSGFPGATTTVGSCNNLTFSNSLSLNKAFSITGTLDVEGTATLTTGGFLTLASGARIADLSDNGGGSISGNITVERLIPGSRKYRLLGHPFNTAQNLAILTDDIDITGNTTGVTSNSAKTLGTGFTATNTNNPSAFWFNTANADGQSYDGGWSAFTSADGSGANNTWGVGEGLRVLIRGTKGEGLDLNSYTPSSLTIDMTGTLNTGNVNIDLVTGGSGSASGF